MFNLICSAKGTHYNFPKVGCKKTKVLKAMIHLSSWNCAELFMKSFDFIQSFGSSCFLLKAITIFLNKFVHFYKDYILKFKFLTNNMVAFDNLDGRITSKMIYFHLWKLHKILWCQQYKEYNEYNLNRLNTKSLLFVLITLWNWQATKLYISPLDSFYSNHHLGKTKHEQTFHYWIMAR